MGGSVSRWVFALGVAGLIASCSGGGGGESTTRVGPKDGVQADLPIGWAGKSGSGGLHAYVDGVEINSDCKSKADFTHVGVDVTVGITGNHDYEKRPKRFDRSSGGGPIANSAEDDCNSSSQWINFSDHGVNATAHLEFGQRATVKHKAEAYAVLNSVRIASAVSESEPEAPNLFLRWDRVDVGPDDRTVTVHFRADDGKSKGMKVVPTIAINSGQVLLVLRLVPPKGDGFYGYVQTPDSAEHSTTVVTPEPIAGRKIVDLLHPQ